MRYRGKQAVLATKHGKEAALRRPICTALGMHLTVPLDFDTDKLGTFSGEIERVRSAKDSAIRKARLGPDSLPKLCNPRIKVSWG